MLLADVDYSPFLFGESTPSYIASKYACKRISETLPNVKLIILMREPSARAYSEYQMKIRRVFTQENFILLANHHANLIRKCLILHTNDWFSIQRCIPEDVTTHGHWVKLKNGLKRICSRFDQSHGKRNNEEKIDGISVSAWRYAVDKCFRPYVVLRANKNPFPASHQVQTSPGGGPGPVPVWDGSCAVWNTNKKEILFKRKSDYKEFLDSNCNISCEHRHGDTDSSNDRDNDIDRDKVKGNSAYSTTRDLSFSDSSRTRVNTQYISKYQMPLSNSMGSNSLSGDSLGQRFPPSADARASDRDLWMYKNTHNLEDMRIGVSQQISWEELSQVSEIL